MSINTLKLVHGRNRGTSCDIFQYGATVISWKVRVVLPSIVPNSYLARFSDTDCRLFADTLYRRS